MITHQEFESSTYPLKNANFVGGFSKKTLAKHKTFLLPVDLEGKQGIFKTVQFDAYC